MYFSPSIYKDEMCTVFYHTISSRKMKGEKRYDVVVVGAGVAGSALAYALGKDGHQVQVIERNLNDPKRIAGEFLQPAGYLKLLELGLDGKERESISISVLDCVKDIDAQRVIGYAVYNNGKIITLPFPLEKCDSDVAGRAFHNGRFVQKLRMKAASLPNVRLEQGSVTSLIEEEGAIKGVRYKIRSGQDLVTYASLTIVCDGGFSSLRKFLANPKIEKLSSYAAAFIIENCQLPHPGYGHLILGDPVSAVLYPISSTEVRFYADIPGPKVPSVSNCQMADFLKTFMAPQVPPEMHDAFISTINKNKIKIIPSSTLPAAPLLKRGAVLLGDALNMRHAITGGGMTVALHDVALLCSLLKNLDLDDIDAVTKHTEYFYKFRKPMGFTINMMASSFHKVTCSFPAEIRKEIQQAGFNYLSLGGAFAAGTVGLISGLKPQPWRLFLSTFAMSIYMVGSMLFPFSSPKRVYTASRFMLGIVISFIMKDATKGVSWLQEITAKAINRCR